MANKQQRDNKAYATRERSVELARKLRKNKEKEKEYRLVGILHLAKGKTDMALLTEQEWKLWEGRKDFHVHVFEQNLKWVNGITQADLAEWIYNKGRSGKLQEVKFLLKVTAEKERLANINKERFPIKTKKGLFIGDPCYVINDNWSEYCGEYFKIDKSGLHHFIFKDYVVGVSKTAYGDGVYTGDDGNVYSVDAGLIGATPLEVTDTVVESLGTIIEGELQARVEYHNGEVHIYIKDRNSIIIQTEDVEYDEDEYDEDEYDEDEYDEEEYEYDEDDGY